MPLDHPYLQRFGRLEFIARQTVEGFITGLHKSPYHGFSVEFAEHRLYNSGEPTRHIDWKLFARTEKLFVKRYEEETNLRCQVVIDQSSSMYYPLLQKRDGNLFNKITFAVYCAASIIYLLKKQRDAAGLSVFDENLRVHTPAKSTAIHQKFLFNELERLLEDSDPFNRRTFATGALHLVADRIHKRSLVIIFSDMFERMHGIPPTGGPGGLAAEPLFTALQHLRHNKHEVVLFHVVDGKREIDFVFDNRPYRFVDMETGKEVKAHPAEIREHYIAAVGNFKKELMLRCGQYGIDFVEADIRKGFEQVLTPYLIKRSRLY